jgi:HPt (histidine-containing phosphotransfer) domain-containing protein
MSLALPDRPVDLVHLARQTFGNKDLETEVLLLFLRQSALMMQRLDGAADDKGWREAAHTVRGSALGIGAWKVAETARAVELLATERRSDEAKRALLALDAAVRDANGFIETIVAA